METQELGPHRMALVGAVVSGFVLAVAAELLGAAFCVNQIINFFEAVEHVRRAPETVPSFEILFG